MALTASEGTELGFSRQDSEKLEEGGKHSGLGW